MLLCPERAGPGDFRSVRPITARRCLRQDARFGEAEKIELHMLWDEDFVDLTPERALRRLLDRVLSAENLRRKTTYEVGDVPTVLQLVRAGLGVAVVPLRLAQTANKHSAACSPLGRAVPIATVGCLNRFACQAVDRVGEEDGTRSLPRHAESSLKASASR